MQSIRRMLCALIVLCPGLAAPLQAQSTVQSTATATLSGSVLDPSGAAIPHASIHLHSAGNDRNATADDSGRFTLSAPAATYSLTVDAVGFRPYARASLVVSSRNPALNITLEIATDTEEVTVSGEPDLSNDAASNKNGIVLKGEQLNTLSDDPAVMQQQLVAMTGSVDPTQPPQLILDGFTGGTMPPKESIREIRINQNPFSSQYDQFGSNRIEVFTKPGTNKFHGDISYSVGNSALNSLNPYTGAQPSYNSGFLRANINGPIGKKSSFFLSVNHNDAANNAIIKAVTLDSNLNKVSFTQAVPNPVATQNYSLRFDHQFGAKDTFIGRYTFDTNNLTNVGVGLFTLPSVGVNSETHTQTLQLSDTHIFSPKVVFDSAFQYIRTRLQQDPTSTAPAIVVQGAFNGGGSAAQILRDNQDRLEFQEYFSISQGKHFIRTGVRYRLLRDSNLATAGYNGQFIFPSIASYQITEQDLKKGYSDQGIRADCRVQTDGTSVCGGATQFSISAGTPSATITTGDLGLYAEDEWKATPKLTLNYGVRFESQTAIPDHFDFGPRIAIAYSIAPDKKTKQPFAVVRAGTGLFFQRFASTNLLQSIRQNGTTQQVYQIANPTFYCDAQYNASCASPTVASIPVANISAPTVYQVNPQLHSPETYQSMVSVEHSLGKYGNVATSFYIRRSVHQFESRNINAPLPGTYNTAIPTSGVRPLGGAQNIYQYSSDGVSNGRTLVFNGNINAGSKINLFAYLSFGHQDADTNGPNSFVSNSYDLGADAGRIGYGYAPRQLYTGANIKPGWGTSFNIFLAARSSTAFNITTGTDLNGDSIYNDRPAFATDMTRPSVVRTAYGNFDTSPLLGQTIIPVNYGDGPASVYTELYAQKTFTFGPRPAAPKTPAAPASGSQATNAPATKPGAPAKAAPLPPRPYKLQFGIQINNPLNHVDSSPPIGVLTSPYFGQSIALNSLFSNAAVAANRSMTLRTSFSF